jgi:hypothetical protein
MKSMTVDQKLDVAYVELRKGKVARTVARLRGAGSN